MSMYIGEALAGEGNEIAHIDLLIGDKDGPVGHAFANALARQSEGHSNLLAVLIDNHREVLVGSIAEQFEELKRDHEKVVRARITSAHPLDDAQRAEIVSALEKRYGKKVEAELDVDPQLLGGARVQVGDQVIHASVRDALAQMAAALTR